MLAAWYERKGPAREVMIVGEMDAPQPGPNQVLVRIHASGVPGLWRIEAACETHIPPLLSGTKA